MDKFCRYCVKDLPIDNFEDGLKTCKTCLEYKRKNYDKHKDKWMKHEELNIKKMKNIEETGTNTKLPW